MAGLDGRDEEINALMDIPGVNPEKIAKQLSGSGKPVDTPKTDPPKTDPPKTDPPKDQPINKDVPDKSAITAGILNEMFGDQFKTVEDVKKANIPAAFQELETLRRTKQDLETQLAKKPKHPFANDDLAKLNEFVSSTGIKDVGIFNKLNVTDLANMSAMDALVTLHIIENPALASKEAQVRQYLETRYNVDPKKVEKEELTQDELNANLIGLEIEAGKAKAKLSELKGKIKMPEIKDEPPAQPMKWTPEKEKVQRSTWSQIGQSAVEGFTKLAIPIRDAKDPDKKVTTFINFEIPKEMAQAAIQRAIDSAVNNQMEINPADEKDSQSKIVRLVKDVHADLIINNLDLIAHAILTRAKGMSQEEILSLYHNPSKIVKDVPDSVNQGSSYEERINKAFNAEMNR